MKMICTYNYSMPDDLSPSDREFIKKNSVIILSDMITLGKAYEVIINPYSIAHDDDDDYIEIIDDKGHKRILSKSNFCTIEEWRDKQLNNILL